MAEITNAVDQVEKPEDFGDDDPGATVRRWMAEIKAAEKYFDPWVENAKRALERYRDERAGHHRRGNPKRFNVLWSNTKTLQPMIYSMSPKAEIQRRFKDSDPVGRLASEILERVIDSLIDLQPFDAAMEAARDDYLLAGRGTVWVRYEPTFTEEPDLFGGVEKVVTDEKACLDYVHWSSFLHGPAPRWDKVPWVGRKEMLTREQLVDRFGDIGKNVPLDHASPGMDKSENLDSYGDVFKRAVVWEIWDKNRGEVIWISPSYKDKWLDRMKDPLGLTDFFPCPPPVYANETTESLLPITDYSEYEDQATELDILTERISLLVKALRIAGVYNSQLGEEMQDLLSSNLENRLIPVDQWALFAEQGGFKGSVAFLPIEEIAAVLQQLYVARQQVKQDLYEITGIADIIRGASQKEETATAQRIKSRFAAVRLEDRQRDFALFARNAIRIMAEIVSEHFEPMTIAIASNWPFMSEAVGQTDQQTFMQAIELMKQDRLRSFRIDIETDSTITPDREMEKQTRMEFLSAVTPFLEKGAVAAQQFPQFAPLLGHMLMFAVRGFDQGRQLEGAFEEAMEQAQQQAAELERMKVEAEIANGQAKIDIERGKLQIELMKLELEKEQVAMQSGENQQKSLALLQEVQNEIDQKQRELDLKSGELDLKRREVELKYGEGGIEQQKLAQGQGKGAVSLDVLGKDAGAVASSMQNMLTDMAKSHGEQGQAMAEAMAGFQQAIAAMTQAIAAPKRVVRDSDGRIVGATTETVQ